jgi:hypothetical protein
VRRFKLCLNRRTRQDTFLRNVLGQQKLADIDVHVSGIVSWPRARTVHVVQISTPPGIVRLEHTKQRALSS